MLTEAQYNRLHEIVFAQAQTGEATYPGYRPEVIEAPNGDGQKDASKRYAHVAMKYLRQWVAPWYRYRELYDVLCEGHSLAMRVARELDVPELMLPSIEHSCLRILEYPPGAGSAPHTDFDLFTLALYRDRPEGFKRHHFTFTRAEHEYQIGEIGQIAGLGPALRHEVLPLDVPQHAIVYFAIPDHAAELPDGQTVGQWLAERVARSRY